jgi:hypothetical protein
MSNERKCSCGGIDFGVGVMHEPICELNDEGWIHKLEEDIKDLESRGTSGRTVYVVTRHKGTTPDGDHLFEIQGVFTSEEKAIAACRDENYGYGPEVLDQELPHESTVWPGYRYPHAPKVD